MLAVTEPGVHIITVKVSTQLLKTSLLENVFGFKAHLDPGPMLLLQPKDDAAEQFSKERIAPMIRATPVLRKLVGGGKTRNSDETLLYKSFPGGFLALAGAGSPDNLARRPIQTLLLDEINKYPITKEGDPIMIAEERTAKYGATWLSVRACTPTVEDECRITQSFEESDQRQASVECPHCAHRQFLDFFKHVHWEKDGNRHFPKTAALFCESCGAMWSEGERLRALKTIRWHQTRPFHCCNERHVPIERYEAAWKLADASAVDAIWTWWASDRYAVYLARCPTCGAHPLDREHAGFTASKLYSPWSKDKPSDIAAKWIAAKDDEDKKQPFYNTQLALAYKRHSARDVPLEQLVSRCEVWSAEVPDGVAVLTAGIDTQDYRVEIEVIGWGANEESWSIEHHVIDGEFSEPSTQKALDEYLKRTWCRADGRRFEILAACHDSGGHHSEAVYAFCKDRIGRRIWAVKGESARNGQRNPVWPTKKPSRRSKASYRPIIIGVNAAKDTISTRLAKVPGPDGKVSGPGAMHYPVDRDINYFAQMTAERLVLKTVGGRRFRVWEQRPGRANEALDCRVYGYAALCGLIHFGLKLNKRAADVAASIGPPLPLPLEPDGQPTADANKVGPLVKGDQKPKTLASKLA